MSGKTTNLLALQQRLAPQRGGALMQLESQDDRTLFFDLWPIGFRQAHGVDLRIKVYTVPGQHELDSTRQAILQAADGLIFVAHSDPTLQGENLAALEVLRHNLAVVGADLDELPMVLQFNKRDLPGALSRDQLAAAWTATPWWPAVLSTALAGEGVVETFEWLMRRLYGELNRHHSLLMQHGIAERTFIERLCRAGVRT
nr:ADP-ribosylation factor-like protein [Halomonas sp. 1513]